MFALSREPSDLRREQQLTCWGGLLLFQQQPTPASSSLGMLHDA